jgi:hypothetical protein
LDSTGDVVKYIPGFFIVYVILIMEGKTMKNFLMLVMALTALGCSSGCMEDKQDDTTEPVVESPITWDDCGGNFGDHACDFTFKDQEDKEISLYDYYGKIIVLDFSVAWCGPCQIAAQNVAAHTAKYDGDGVVWITVLLQDYAGNLPELHDVQDWSVIYGIPSWSPVLQGNSSVVDYTAEDGYPVSSYPTIVVIDREMVIYSGIHGWSQTAIETWVDELIAADQ